MNVIMSSKQAACSCIGYQVTSPLTAGNFVPRHSPYDDDNDDDDVCDCCVLHTGSILPLIAKPPFTHSYTLRGCTGSWSLVNGKHEGEKNYME